MNESMWPMGRLLYKWTKEQKVWGSIITAGHV